MLYMLNENQTRSTFSNKNNSVWVKINAQRIFREISKVALDSVPGAVNDVYTHTSRAKTTGENGADLADASRGRCSENTRTAATSGRTNEIITIIIFIVIIIIFLYLQHRNNMTVHDRTTHGLARVIYSVICAIVFERCLFLFPFRRHILRAYLIIILWKLSHYSVLRMCVGSNRIQRRLSDSRAPPNVLLCRYACTASVQRT